MEKPTNKKTNADEIQPDIQAETLKVDQKTVSKVETVKKPAAKKKVTKVKKAPAAKKTTKTTAKVEVEASEEAVVEKKATKAKVKKAPAVKKTTKTTAKAEASEEAVVEKKVTKAKVKKAPAAKKTTKTTAKVEVEASEEAVVEKKVTKAKVKKAPAAKKTTKTAAKVEAVEEAVVEKKATKAKVKKAPAVKKTTKTTAKVEAVEEAVVEKKATKAKVKKAPAVKKTTKTTAKVEVEASEEAVVEKKVTKAKVKKAPATKKTTKTAAKVEAVEEAVVEKKVTKAKAKKAPAVKKTTKTTAKVEVEASEEAVVEKKATKAKVKKAPAVKKTTKTTAKAEASEEAVVEAKATPIIEKIEAKATEIVAEEKELVTPPRRVLKKFVPKKKEAPIADADSVEKPSNEEATDMPSAPKKVLKTNLLRDSPSDSEPQKEKAEKSLIFVPQKKETPISETTDEPALDKVEETTADAKPTETPLTEEKELIAPPRRVLKKFIPKKKEAPIADAKPKAIDSDAAEKPDEAKPDETTSEPKKVLKRNLLRDSPSDSEPQERKPEKTLKFVPKKSFTRADKPRESANTEPRERKTLKFVPKKNFSRDDKPREFERPERRERAEQSDRPTERTPKDLKFVPKKKDNSAFDKFIKKDEVAKTPKPDAPEKKEPGTVGTRLNKYLAHSGLGSRRQTSAMVFEGKVKVNGEVMLNPAYSVQEGDIVETEGKSMKPKSKKMYILLNKPKNATTEITTADSEQRTAQTIVATKHKEVVTPFETMGIQVTGLLILSNDQALIEKFQNPEQKIKRIFHLKLDKRISLEDLKQAEQKLEPASGPIKGHAVNHVLGAELDEVGINLMIGNIELIQTVFADLGYQIKKLDCTYYAGLTKKDLPRGWFRELNKQEVIMLKHFI